MQPVNHNISTFFKFANWRDWTGLDWLQNKYAHTGETWKHGEHEDGPMFGGDEEEWFDDVMENGSGTDPDYPECSIPLF